MDSRIYFHQYRRPRCYNPTYISSNVGYSLSFFNDSSANHQDTYRSQLNAPRSNSNNSNSYNFDPLPTTNAPARQQSSKLSGIGERSLMLMDQRGVYHKQTSKYDIINLKPLEHSQDIKQYPWFTVQNRDDVYYRRMNQQANANMGYTRSKTTEKPQEIVAGKHTYAMEQRMPVNPEPSRVGQGNRGEKFTAKMLNHMDELQHNLA